MVAPAFVLSRHAREELERRGIRREMLDEVLTRPEQIVPGHAGLTVYQSRVAFGAQPYLLRAVVDLTRNPALVITAYRTSKIAKYWRSE